MTMPDGLGAAPPGWPDVATLTRLAKEIFTGQLGGVPNPTRAVEGSPQAIPESAAAAAAGGQAVTPPVAAPYDLLGPSVPGPDLDALPRSTPAAAPSTPYYFIAEARPLASPHGRAPQPAPFTPAPDPAFYFADLVRSDVQPEAGRSPTAAAPFDVHAVRRDFPILRERVNGHRLVWLDNAATTQKPQAVIDRLASFYAHENSNIHRAAHELAARATDGYEAARRTVAGFLGAASPDEVVFVRGTTEAINLVAQSWGREYVGADDEMVIPHLEHHANIVPWQQLAAEKGAKLRVIPVDDTGQILLDEYRRLLNDRTRLVAVAHVANALGTVLPVREVIEMAHAVGARVLLDGAQAVSHLPVNVQTLDSDFYVFSGHKVFAPTGVGVLHGKAEVLESMPPWQGGGNMIKEVTFERTTYQPPPGRFEAGTGTIADAVGLGAALDYLQQIGLDSVARYEHDLLGYATRALDAVPGLHLIGTAPNKASILSFVLDGYRVEEVGSALNHEGIAVRAGHHCAQPIMRRFGVNGTVRPSLAMYNTPAEVDQLAAVLHRLAAEAGRARR